MKLTIKYPIAIASVFIWVGFVGAISFMEAWLKFQAPGITLPLGLGIGRLVFNALNKVELVLSIVIIASMVFGGIKKIKWEHLLFFLPFLIVVLQSTWLLPALDIRAEMHIQGRNVPSSNLHFCYIGMEVIKVTCLMIFGIKLFKS
ncbi:MAG: hypothetical protein ACRBG0_27980 [Lewinella sp.]|uniref:hypothetical protein n=1 Tax=Lewinella sp. TaxID=2004506 RepID=UPI003D6AA77A